MPINADNFPVFPHSVHTLIAESVLTLLQGNADLSSFCVGGINEIGSEPIRETGVKRFPALWVHILDDSEEALPSGMAFVTTTISILLVDTMGRFNNSKQNLYRRVLASAQRLIHLEINLVDEFGNFITDSTISFNRVEAAVIQDSDSFSIELQAVFGTTIEQATQLPMGVP